MLNRLVILGLVAVQVALSSPVQSRASYAIKESHSVPKAYASIGPAPADTNIELQIGLKQAQFDELERQLYDGLYPLY